MGALTARGSASRPCSCCHLGLEWLSLPQPSPNSAVSPYVDVHHLRLSLTPWLQGEGGRLYCDLVYLFLTAAAHIGTPYTLDWINKLRTKWMVSSKNKWVWSLRQILVSFRNILSRLRDTFETSNNRNGLLGDFLEGLVFSPRKEDSFSLISWKSEQMFWRKNSWNYPVKVSMALGRCTGPGVPLSRCESSSCSFLVAALETSVCLDMKLPLPWRVCQKGCPGLHSLVRVKWWLGKGFCHSEGGESLQTPQCIHPNPITTL